MNTRHLAVLAAFTIASTVIPSALAQDPYINDKIAVIGKELRSRSPQGPNPAVISNAALAISKRTPSGLRPMPKQPDNDGFELNSPGEPQAPLALREDHRLKLLRIFQTLALELTRASRRPAEETADAVKTLDDFLDGIEDLGRLRPKSKDFVDLLQQLLATPLPPPPPPKR